MQLDATTIQKALDFAYDKAVDGVPGVPGLESAKGLAQDYLNDSGSLEDRVGTLIRYQIVKASASGFLTGLGGIITLPVTVPANVASIMYLQLQTVAAIAHMGGHDVRNDRVRTVCYACLCGNAATDVLKAAGITVGKKLTEHAIKQMSFEVIKKINQKVGFRLITKFGQTGVVNLGKAIPLVGGVVGGTFDGATTYTIGHVAKSVFIEDSNTSHNDHERDDEETDIFENLSEWFLPEDDKRDKRFFGGS